MSQAKYHPLNTAHHGGGAPAGPSIGQGYERDGMRRRTGSSTLANFIYGCGIVSALVGLALLITIVVLLAQSKHAVHRIAEETACEPGAHCTDPTLVGGEGTCDALGACRGTPKGMCFDEQFDFSNTTAGTGCRQINYTWPIDAFGLFNTRICFAGMCVWVVDGSVDGFFDDLCDGSGDGNPYELNEIVADAACRTLISEDPEAALFESTATCSVDGTPLCIYRYRSAYFSLVGGSDVPPGVFMLSNSANSGSASQLGEHAAQAYEEGAGANQSGVKRTANPARIRHVLEDDGVVGLINDMYEAYKAERAPGKRTQG
jgi:hypothetical protein